MASPELVDALTRMYASRGAQAVDALRPHLSDDFTFVPGGTDRGQLQGEYLGADGFLAFIEAQAEWTGDTWWPRLNELVVGDRWIIGVVFVDATRASDGEQVQFQIIHRWKIDGDRITAFQSFNNDQRRYDAFHGADDAAR
jgi:ketosteroid isomerase-like protein